MKLKTDPLPFRPGDERLIHLLGELPSCRASIIGFPIDEGVAINGGRQGAKEGPTAFRRALARLTPDPRLGDSGITFFRSVHDLGDISAGLTLEKAHDELAQRVASELHSGVVPLIIGGGHETSLGHFLGYATASIPVEIINLDAHPDVRERIQGRPHSGSSFRDALEWPTNACLRYSVLGLQPLSTARAHLQYLNARGGTALWAEEVTSERISATFAALTRKTLVTIDLDCVDSAFAPGVSAPAVGGLMPALLFHFAFEAGRSPHVGSLDIVELNPAYDIDGRTARLSAIAAWHFLRGLFLRGHS